jgi:hypothetical protein
MRSDGQVRADRQMLEPGVYQEWLDANEPNFEAVIIDQPAHPGSPWDNLGVAWRKTADSPWEGPWKQPNAGEGCFHSHSLRPHPDGDAIWAEYVASRLSD